MKIEALSFKQVLSGLVLITVLTLIAGDNSRAMIAAKVDAVINPLREV